MRHVKTSRVMGMALCALAVFSADGVFAQAVAAPAAEIVRITKVTELGRDMLQRAVGLGGKSAKAKTWGVLDVAFDTAPEWINELTVTFTVMLYNEKPLQGEKAISLFQITSVYGDVARGRDHRVGVVLLPVALERFGRPIGFAAQMFVDGNSVGEFGVGDGILSKENRWWKNDKITASPIVQKREGYLLERSKSPFYLVDIDSYEVSR